MQKESELSFVLGYILMAAGGVEGQADLRLSSLAAEAFAGMLSSGSGNVAIGTLHLIGMDIQFEKEKVYG